MTSKRVILTNGVTTLPEAELVDGSGYRKKPVVIEAMQFDGTPESASRIIDWVLAGGHTAKMQSLACEGDVPPWGVFIYTPEGTMAAGKDDFIIRGVQGEFYPCKPDIWLRFLLTNENAAPRSSVKNATD